MSASTTLLLYLAMSAVTYFSRRLFLRVPSKYFSPRLINGLTFIPVGIFAGLIFPSLFVSGQQLVFQPVFLIASAICLLVMALSRNVFLSFGIGLAFVIVASLELF
ncbi:AzlD domain-containing protein [Brevibacillus fulvus]|uniref:Branched-subunit amino acid transport protein n=1 Tax=Brevibacillus fulvus TaxID=1125967 RepID=A0A938Y0I7_9BACL|nr:AzlD domain-containing protein [Brevibacillus fulvus]MBM7590953.1 branched-subunit amino acid transport protein [Brevibacillus fulvus]